MTKAEKQMRAVDITVLVLLFLWIIVLAIAANSTLR